MQKALLIAEKPDLMRKIQEVYEDHGPDIPYTIKFTSQRGHLVTLKSPDEIDEDQKKWCWENLPFHPEEHGGWQYKVIEEPKSAKYLTAKERFDIIAKELKSGEYDFVINAGDPDQEGELLVRLVLSFAKNKLPVKRFWTNDLTETHILNALKNLKDDDHDPMLIHLLDAAYARQHSDYRFGMNISRAATLKMNARVACGRVKTPILSIVCRREDEIENFVQKTVYGVKAEYMEKFEGSMFEAATASSEEDEKDEDKKNGIVWFEDRADAEAIVRSLPPQGTVKEYEEKKSETYAPKLFKLATLQIEAGKMGYSDGNTLRIIQKLYEKKLLSYPRTDCEYLSSSEDFLGILGVLNGISDFTPFIKGKIVKADIERVRKSKKWINDSALEESGHSAIRPTTEAPNFAELDPDEIEIYKLVCRRFIAMFLPPLIQMNTRLVTDIDGRTFISTGKRLVDPGYTTIFGTKFTDKEIPAHAIGDVLAVEQFVVSEKKTQCPKRYTSPDLIAVCENPAKYLEDPALRTALGKKLKLGTPATRSPIIEQLIEKDKYLQVVKEGKRQVVVPTEVGRAIIRNLGPCDICKIDMTGEWELKLEDIRNGSMTLPDLEEKMKQYVVDMIEDIKRTPMTPFEGRSATKVIGSCPVCGKDIIESEKGFSCRGYVKDGSGCNIKLWKSKFGAAFSYEEAEKLWKGEEIIKSVTVSLRTWEQKLKYNFSTYDVEFVKGVETDICTCPCCGGKIVADENNFRCTSCDLKGSRSVCGALLSDENLKTLFGGSRVTVTCKKEEKSWEQALTFQASAKKIEFYSGETSAYDCPCCGKVKMNVSDKSFRCPNCSFSLWKTSYGHPLTEEEIDTFMKTGRVGPLTMNGKKGPYKATLVINKRKKETKLEFAD